MAASQSSSHGITFLFLFAAIGITVLHATNGEDEEGPWKCKPGAALYENRCYQTYRPSPKCSEDFSFAAANAYCEANGGELASIRNQSHNDWITALIKKDQHAKDKRNKCSDCPSAKKDYFYWIGLQLDHSANGSVSGASWTDGTAVTYGNPLSASFRPPFVSGHPEGSKGDNSVPGEVCPLGNEKECAAIYGYGSTVGKWIDRNCSSVHTQNVSCSCVVEEQGGNSTQNDHHHHEHKHHSSSSSSSEEEGEIDECRDEAALNGFVCQYCPDGWTMFQGRCYMALTGSQSTAQWQASCQALNSQVVSIHSTAENQFVANLATAANPANGANFIGLWLDYGLLGAITGVHWYDNSPVNYGNPTAPGFVRGTYPWAPAGQPAGFPAQPDNLPPPGNCVLQWLSGQSGEPASTWDDANCPQMSTGSTVCKI